MLSFSQSIVIVIAIVCSSTIFLCVLNRLWPAQRRGVHNDIVGWQVGVLGTTYAVIVGFMLYTVWTNFTAADVNVDAEANGLIGIERLSYGLPASQRDAIQELTRQYADAMVNREWPAMYRGEDPTDSHEITLKIWAAVMQPGSLDAFQQTSLDHTMYELSSMTEHRRIRQLQSQSSLPWVLWAVLVIGAIMVIASSCLFGTENTLLHYLQVFALSLLLGFSLVAIADIDRPFQGSVHVKPTAFERARESMGPPVQPR